MLIDAAGLRAYIGAVLSETEAGGVMEMPVFGSSMAPFLIHGRDAVRLVKCTHPPKRGEIVLFRRLDGQYVLHRVCRVIAVRRKGKWYGRNSALWRFFTTVWLVLTPVRPLFIAMLARRHAQKEKVPNGA